MIWAYPDIQLILILGTSFALLYGLYLTRFWLINRRLKVEKSRLLTKLFLRVLYFGLFLVALAGPSVGTAVEEVKQEGKDIFLAVDLSQSMNAKDIGPDRLQRIKFELKELLKNFPSNRIGLIIFSTEAYLQCPLTFDQHVLQLYIDGLHTGLVPGGSTDLGGPLRIALERFQNDNTPEESSKSIVLISDGEDFGKNYESILSDLSDQGIRVFSLGIGTEEGSVIPARNGVILNPTDGQPVISKLDQSSLQQIAAETGGAYFEISDQVNQLNDLVKGLEMVESTTIGSKQIETSSNKYFYFLLAALALSLLDMILPIKTIKL